MSQMNALATRRTPRTDAWVARLKVAVTPHGKQSELARWLCAQRGRPEPTRADITRWVSTFFRWFRRTGLPGLEDALLIDDWLRAESRRGRRAEK